MAATVDRLRAYAKGIEPDTPGNAVTGAVVLAASDPANPYGATLAWPVRDADTAHRPGRKAGALVVLVDGDLIWFVERGGRSLLSFTSGAETNNAAAAALADLVAARRIDSLMVERIDGVPVLDRRDSIPAGALTTAGFARTPRGLRLR
jgi:ATP-dependent Lhr-like helicase